MKDLSSYAHAHVACNLRIALIITADSTGVYTYANDTTYTGHWHKGRRHGEGHYTLKNLNKYFERREHGELIGERKIVLAQ